jgi:hypothetical protein
METFWEVWGTCLYVSWEGVRVHVKWRAIIYRKEAAQQGTHFCQRELVGNPAQPTEILHQRGGRGSSAIELLCPTSYYYIIMSDSGTLGIFLS